MTKLTLAIFLVILLLILSSIICVVAAKKKGQDLYFWGLMGLLFGPGAIGAMFFTDTDLPRSNNYESLNDRVKYFYDLGLLDIKKTHQKVANEIRLKHIEDWGENPETKGILDDYIILKYGSGKIWWKDTEADVLNGNNVYVHTLNEWAEISENSFSPMKIIEKWKTDEGPIVVEFELNQKPHAFYPEYLDDYIDIDILKKINKLMPNEKNQFEWVVPFDQTAFVMWVSKVEKRDLIRRGWRFSW